MYLTAPGDAEAPGHGSPIDSVVGRACKPALNEAVERDGLRAFRRPVRSRRRYPSLHRLDRGRSRSAVGAQLTALLSD
jgi:hypothetical protein